MAMRIDALRHAGGVNSFDNFARSWQRAAGFFEITPIRSPFRFTDEAEGESSYRKQDLEHSPEAGRSLLHAALQSEGRRFSEDALADDEATSTRSENGGDTQDLPVGKRIDALRRRYSRDNSIFSIEPSLASPFGGSYGTMYGSLASRVSDTSMRHAARLFTEQQVKGVSEPDGKREPLMVKQVEEEGRTYNVVVGQSTLPQTIFNSVNVLVGVSLLSLPLGVKYSGWVIGGLFFIFLVVSTQYTAKLLAKCLDVDSSLITFADLAYVSFGHSARVATSIFFCLELIATNVALVILFGDSLDALIPGWGIVGWKFVCCIVLIPLAFLPLRLLSFTSILGILSCLGSEFFCTRT
jgi:vesicular inhibitory amino acid transporter